MDDLISRQAAIEAITDQNGVVDKSVAKRVLAQLPSVQFDRGYIEQIKWERDLDIRQLADLGYGLGEKPRTSGDFISRQAAIKAICEDGTWLESQGCTEITMAERKQRDADILGELPSAQPEQRWMPFTTRPLTEEEKEEHSEWDSILDCKLPDDGQRILVSVSARGHERVQYDEFYEDDGSYLDSGYEIGTEAVAWMPLPEPYKEEKSE